MPPWKIRLEDNPTHLLWLLYVRKSLSLEVPNVSEVPPLVGPAPSTQMKLSQNERQQAEIEWLTWWNAEMNIEATGGLGRRGLDGSTLSRQVSPVSKALAYLHSLSNQKGEIVHESWGHESPIITAILRCWTNAQQRDSQYLAFNFTQFNAERMAFMKFFGMRIREVVDNAIEENPMTNIDVGVVLLPAQSEWSYARGNVLFVSNEFVASSDFQYQIMNLIADSVAVSGELPVDEARSWARIFESPPAQRISCLASPQLIFHGPKVELSLVQIFQGGNAFEIEFAGTFDTNESPVEMTGSTYYASKAAGGFHRIFRNGVLVFPTGHLERFADFILEIDFDSAKQARYYGIRAMDQAPRTSVVHVSRGFRSNLEDTSLLLLVVPAEYVKIEKICIRWPSKGIESLALKMEGSELKIVQN